MPRLLRALGFMLALLALLTGTAHAQQSAISAGPIDLQDRLRSLATLWQEANYNFAYFDRVPKLDWDSRFAAYVPAVTAAESTFDFYRVLQRFLAELNDGHTLVFLPDSIVKRRPQDVPALELEEIAHRAFVSNVDSALAKQLPVGSEILLVDNLSVADHLQRFVFPLMSVSTEHVRWRDAIRGSQRHLWGLLWGSAGTQVRVTARTPTGKLVQVDLTRNRGTRAPHWMIAQSRRPLLEFKVLADGLSYVALNSFNDAAIVTQFDSLMPSLVVNSGIVLDVRRNGGGTDDVVKQILTRLTTDTLLGPAWRTRTHNATFKAWGRFADQATWAEPYRSYWTKPGVWHVSAPDTLLPSGATTVRAPIVVLIGSQTASAAENFLIYIHKQKRFTLVGQPTNGSSGQPLMLDLPGGGTAWICTKRNTYPDGTTYIGTGVIPDVAVPITVEDVRSGRDRALETAIQLLKNRRP